MKLGFSYNLFDGEELLRFAIRAIRDSVDFVSVVYQTESNYGEELQFKFYWLDLVDESFHFQPDLSLTPRQNETAKRNIGRDLSQKAGCSHHASLDVDEFYTPEDIDLVRDLKEDASICRYSNYFKNPTWKIVPADKFVVSFVHKIEHNYSMDASFRYNVDPTRKLQGVSNYRIYNREELEMQHMTFVRSDIERKIRNSSCRDQYAEMAHIYDTYKLGDDLVLPPSKSIKTTIEVEDQFGIKETGWEHIV